MSWADCTDPDAVWRHLARQVLGQGDERQLAGAVAGETGVASLAAHEARLTTEPERCVIMCGKTARLTMKTPSTLTRSIVCSTSSGISGAGPVQSIPALLTSTSILWKRKSPQPAGRWGNLVRPGSQCASSTSSTPKGQC